MARIQGSELSQGLATTGKAQTCTHTRIKLKVEMQWRHIKNTFHSLCIQQYRQGGEEERKEERKKKILIEILWMIRVVLKITGVE